MNRLEFLFLVGIGVFVGVVAILVIRAFRYSPLQRSFQSRERGDFAEAKEWAEFAIESAATDLERAEALDQLALLHRITGANQLSVEVYRRALLLRQSILPAGDPNLGASYNNLGLAQLFAGQLREGENNLRHGTEIVRASPDSEEQLVAHALSGLGSAWPALMSANWMNPHSSLTKRCA